MDSGLALYFSAMAAVAVIIGIVWVATLREVRRSQNAAGKKM